MITIDCHSQSVARRAEREILLAKMRAFEQSETLNPDEDDTESSKLFEFEIWILFVHLNSSIIFIYIFIQLWLQSRFCFLILL